MTEDDVYAWAIEYPVHNHISVVFVLNDGRHDIAYVEKRAADLRGRILRLANKDDRRSKDDERS